MTRFCLILAAVLFLAVIPSGESAQTMETQTFTSGNCSFSYSKSGVTLKYKDVTIIRKSSLYVVSPGWSKLLFGHHVSEHEITSEEISGGKLVKVSMGNDVFHATYNVTLLETDEVTIDLVYELLEDEPAEMEYCLGYFSAPILASAPFEAETVQGPKSGIVPHMATSSDQFESMLVPEFNRLKVDSRLAEIDLKISGSHQNLVIFDARLEHQAWAREAPIFWCGLGVPARPIQFGGEFNIKAELKFTPSAQAKTLPKIEAPVEIIPVENAQIPAADFIKIIPEPKVVQYTGSDFIIKPDTLIILSDEPSEHDYFAAECLNEELRDIYGIELEVISAIEAKSGSNIIAIGEPDRHSLVAKLARDIRLELPEREEGYSLKVSPHFAIMAGFDTSGTFYGVQTILQLLKPKVEGVAIHGAVVNDWPTMEFRGAHVFVGNEAKPFLKRLIREIFSRHKLNTIVIQADYTKWETSPGIHLPWSTSKEDLSEITAFAREHYMDVIPLVQSLGHSEWMFKNDTNLHLAEDPSHPYAYCPSNPESYEFILSVYDEAIEIFEPEIFHIGHDEITMFGKFPNHPECKEKGVTRLFLDDMEILYNYFAEKGIRVMMWGDMMLYKSETPDAGWAHSLESAKEIRESLPKDIIIADWHYAPAEDFPSVRIFRDLGYEVVACTWYTQRNIENFSRSAKRDGASGLMQTLWAGFNINERTLTPAFHQFHAYILAAEYAWNEGGTTLADLGYDPAEEFTKIWQRDKIELTAKDGFALDISPYANIALGGDDDSWLGYGSEHDLKSFETGDVRFRGIRFNVGDKALLLSGQMNPPGEWLKSIEMPVNQKADKLVFLLTSGWHAEPGTSVGRITMRYSNTEAMVVDLVYGENIVAWNDMSAAPLSVLAWVGSTEYGEKAGIRMIKWENPFPQRAIQSIELSSYDTEAGQIIFAVSGLTE